MFNITALIDSLRLIQYWFGLRKPKYEVNGYTNFLPEEDEYDLDKAVINLYGSKKNKEQFNSDVQGFSTICIVWLNIMANGSQMTAITAKTYKKNT